VLVSTLEGGKEQRKYKGPLPREWTLSFQDTAANIDTIAAFFDARQGSFESFTWTIPGTSTSVSVRFKEGSLKISRQGHGVAGLQVTFREVL